MNGVAGLLFCVSGLAGLISIACLLWFYLSGRKEQRLRDEMRRQLDTGKMRVAAFCPRSKEPTGYYVIQRFDGLKWRDLHEWCSTFNRWVPVLRHYEEAKQQATEWKDPFKYQEWAAGQKRRAEAFREERDEKRRKLYPVNTEEV